MKMTVRNLHLFLYIEEYITFVQVEWRKPLQDQIKTNTNDNLMIG